MMNKKNSSIIEKVVLAIHIDYIMLLIHLIDRYHAAYL